MNKLAELLKEARGYVTAFGPTECHEPCQSCKDAERLIAKIDAALAEHKKVKNKAENTDIFWNRVRGDSSWQCANYGNYTFLEAWGDIDGKKWHWFIRADIKGTASTEAEAKEAAIKAAKGL